MLPPPPLPSPAIHYSLVLTPSIVTSPGVASPANVPPERLLLTSDLWKVTLNRSIGRWCIWLRRLPPPLIIRWITTNEALHTALMSVLEATFRGLLLIYPSSTTRIVSVLQVRCQGTQGTAAHWGQRCTWNDQASSSVLHKGVYINMMYITEGEVDPHVRHASFHHSLAAWIFRCQYMDQASCVYPYGPVPAAIEDNEANAPNICLHMHASTYRTLSNTTYIIPNHAYTHIHILVHRYLQRYTLLHIHVCIHISHIVRSCLHTYIY